MSSIAVIIPTYDRQKLLLKAVKGIKKQSFKVKEIFIVDTNPFFKNETVVKAISKKLDLKIRYLKYNGKKSAHYARNIAVKKCKSKYLAFLDDDDCWEKNYLLCAYNKIIKTKSDMCITEYKVVNKKGKTKYTFHIPKKIDIKNLFIWNPGVICSNILIRKSIFNKIGGYDYKLFGSADKEILIKILLKNYTYVVLKKRLVNYLVHNDQWSKNDNLTLKSTIGLFKKYNKKMNLATKTKVIKKIIFLTFKTLFKI
jgi:glycosyltransferase involved in cell wall biosynthesis